MEFSGIMPNPTYAKVKEGAEFARFAVNVWGIDAGNKPDEELALDGINALDNFIQEVGLPSSFNQMNIDSSTDFKAIAQSVNITIGCCKQMSYEEILEILNECM